MPEQFDEVLVERLARSYYEAKTHAHARTLGFDEPIKWQDAGQARQLAHQDGIRAVLSSLSATHAIVAKAESTTFYIQSDKDPSVWVCSKCNLEWQFPKGNPDENSMEFCPGCGRQIANVIGYAPFAKKEALPHA